MVDNARYESYDNQRFKLGGIKMFWNWFIASMFLVGLVTTLSGFVLLLNYLSTISFAII